MPKPRTAASHKYNLLNYDRIEITVIKGQKKVIKEYAEDHAEEHGGSSLNNYIRGLIYKDMGIDEPTMDQIKKNKK